MTVQGRSECHGERSNKLFSVKRAWRCLVGASARPEGLSTVAVATHGSSRGVSFLSQGPDVCPQ